MPFKELCCKSLMLTEIDISSKRNLVVYAAHIALLNVKVVLEVAYVPNRENLFESGVTGLRFLNRMTRWK